MVREEHFDWDAEVGHQVLECGKKKTPGLDIHEDLAQKLQKGC